MPGWARKLLASMRVTNVSVAAMQVTTSVNPTSLPYVARWPFAVPEVAACFDCAVAVDVSLETHVHPRRDRGEPCAPKAEFVPGLLGSRFDRRQARPYQQSRGQREGAEYLGASGRASVRALHAARRRAPSRRRRLVLR